MSGDVAKALFVFVSGALVALMVAVVTRVAWDLKDYLWAVAFALLTLGSVATSLLGLHALFLALGWIAS